MPRPTVPEFWTEIDGLHYCSGHKAVIEDVPTYDATVYNVVAIR